MNTTNCDVTSPSPLVEDVMGNAVSAAVAKSAVAERLEELERSIKSVDHWLIEFRSLLAPALGPESASPPTECKPAIDASELSGLELDLCSKITSLDQLERGFHDLAHRVRL